MAPERIYNYLARICFFPLLAVAVVVVARLMFMLLDTTKKYCSRLVLFVDFGGVLSDRLRIPRAVIDGKMRAHKKTETRREKERDRDRVRATTKQ